mmetsp:Transcript_83164/g.165067  ORF Transcript_83164/g.165067 Transcript_83164/m.165067 type:complete len:110 (+) Transcript_83164:112-441(+)
MNASLLALLFLGAHIAEANRQSNVNEDVVALQTESEAKGNQVCQFDGFACRYEADDFDCDNPVTRDGVNPMTYSPCQGRSDLCTCESRQNGKKHWFMEKSNGDCKLNCF